MAATVTISADHRGVSRPKVVGDEYVVNAVISISSYTTGGESITAAQLGLSSITSVTITGLQQPATYLVSAEIDGSGDYATDAVQLFSTDLDGTNAETTSTTAVGAVRVRVSGLI